MRGIAENSNSNARIRSLCRMLEFIVHAFSSEVCYVFDSQGMYLFLSVFFFCYVLFLERDVLFLERDVLFLERDILICNLVRSPP